ADFVAMHDLRGEGTWSITVTQLSQFKNGENDLTGAQLSFNKASVESATVESVIIFFTKMFLSKER
uniref:WxL domain-containing protein n=1 Tax=Lactococcus petauri TaxID=1940789 RepID=UPI0023ED8DAE